jgi:predicted nucleotidyltransferase
MIRAVQDQKETLDQLCRSFGVRCLELFGSAASDDHFDAGHSDLDFLVEFEPMNPVRHAKSYFGLLTALQDLFAREVDLVEIKAVTNPYFLDSINKGRRQIYAA